MSLATATWIPGFEQHLAVAGSGGAYTDEVHVKFVWHTSESPPGSIDGIIKEMLGKQHTDVYHAMADPSTRRRAQVLPLNVAASALAHPPEVQTNHDGAVQVCIIGRAHDMPNLSADDLEWLGTDVLAPISLLVPELHIDISAEFYADTAGFTLATASARQRMAPAVWDNFNGQAGHQHVPGNDHWDPGGLNVRAITTAAHTVLNPTASGEPGQQAPAPRPTEEPMRITSHTANTNGVWRGIRVDVAAQTMVPEGGCTLNPNPTEVLKGWTWEVADDIPDDPIDHVRRYQAINTKTGVHETFRAA